MNFSKGTNYALHTMLYLAMQHDGTKISLQELADKRNIPASYLSKMLTKLSKQGLIEAHSGAQGGFQLAKAPSEISFLNIIHAIEGDLPLFKGCDNRNEEGCLVENIMKEAENAMDQYLANTTLESVIQKNEGNYLIKHM